MLKKYCILLGLAFCIAACNSAKAPPSTTNLSSNDANLKLVDIPQETNEVVLEANNTGLNEEEEYRYQAFMKQGDAQYEAGSYREALNLYRKAENIAPERIDKSKMVACLKALQVPSTRRAKK